MKRFRARVLLALLAGMAGMAGTGACAAAAAADASAPSPALRLAFGGISLDQAVQMAQARYGARVVRADTERSGDRVYYRLRLLSPDGRVFSVRVDAQTGSMS